MALTPLISTLKCNRNAFSFACKSYNKLSLSRKLHTNAYSYCHSLPPFSNQSMAPTGLYSLSQAAISPIACVARNTASGEEDSEIGETSAEDDDQALDSSGEEDIEIGETSAEDDDEALHSPGEEDVEDAEIGEISAEDNNQDLDPVHKMYGPINNKNSQELSEIPEDESPGVCKLPSLFQAFQGKKQVLDLLSQVTKILEKNFKIVAKTGLDDGTNVGVKWRFEWEKAHASRGKEFSFHVSQTCKGKAMIRMLTEELLHPEPFGLKVMAYYVALMTKMGSLAPPQVENNPTKILCIVLPLLSLAVFLCLRLISKFMS